MKVLVTGAAGFICGYLIREFLQADYDIIGLDNFCKYGPLKKSYDGHPRYTFVQGDAKDSELMRDLLADCDHFDAAIHAHKHGRLQKITVMSSSMVFENTTEFPTPEGADCRIPPPRSTYGFQKLATEYFARGAWEQYGLPYSIVRPFNCVGIGEKRALRDRDIASGNVTLAMSHVVPDLVQKILKGQDPLHILGSGNQARHYTYGGDLAKGIRLCLEHAAALNQDFNLSTPVRTTVLELAQMIWRKIHGDRKPFRYVSDPPYEHDVQERSPRIEKAAMLLGFNAITTLSEILDEVIPWIAEAVEVGQI